MIYNLKKINNRELSLYESMTYADNLTKYLPNKTRSSYTLYEQMYNDSEILLEGVGETIKNAINKFIQFIKSIFEKIIEFIKGIIEKIRNGLRKLKEKIFGRKKQEEAAKDVIEAIVKNDEKKLEEASKKLESETAKIKKNNDELRKIIDDKSLTAEDKAQRLRRLSNLNSADTTVIAGKGAMIVTAKNKLQDKLDSKEYVYKKIDLSEFNIELIDNTLEDLETLRNNIEGLITGEIEKEKIGKLLDAVSSNTPSDEEIKSVLDQEEEQAKELLDSVVTDISLKTVQDAERYLCVTNNEPTDIKVYESKLNDLSKVLRDVTKTKKSLEQEASKIANRYSDIPNINSNIAYVEKYLKFSINVITTQTNTFSKCIEKAALADKHNQDIAIDLARQLPFEI